MWPTTSYTLLRELVDPAKRDAAWVAFADRYGPPIRACCVRWNVPAHELDAAVNGVLIHLLVKLDRYAPQDGVGFRNWLSTLIRNHVMTEHRGSRLFKSFGPLPEDDLLAAAPRSDALRFADDLAGGLSGLLDDDQERTLAEVRAGVSDRDWAIAMRVLAGETAKEVGAEYGLDPLNTGKTAQSVRRKIQEAWARALGLDR